MGQAIAESVVPRFVGLPSIFHVSHEHVEAQVQRFRNPRNHFERNHGYSAFDLAHVGPADSSLSRESLLRNTAILAKPANGLSKGYWQRAHSRTVAMRRR